LVTVGEHGHGHRFGQRSTAQMRGRSPTPASALQLPTIYNYPVSLQRRANTVLNPPLFQRSTVAVPPTTAPVSPSQPAAFGNGRSWTARRCSASVRVTTLPPSNGYPARCSALAPVPPMSLSSACHRHTTASAVKYDGHVVAATPRCSPPNSESPTTDLAALPEDRIFRAHSLPASPCYCYDSVCAFCGDPRPMTKVGVRCLACDVPVARQSRSPGNYESGRRFRKPSEQQRWCGARRCCRTPGLLS